MVGAEEPKGCLQRVTDVGATAVVVLDPMCRPLGPDQRDAAFGHQLDAAPQRRFHSRKAAPNSASAR